MDRDQFDALARHVWTRHSRRAALATVLGALLLRQEALPVAAKRNGNGNGNGNNANKRKNRRKRKADAQRPLDCPDGIIECWVENYPGGPCDTQAGALPGKIGTCYTFPFCNPCDPPDQDHWSNLCNQSVAACQGRCVAILRMPFIPAGGYCCPPGSCI